MKMFPIITVIDKNEDGSDMTQDVVSLSGGGTSDKFDFLVSP